MAMSDATRGELCDTLVGMADLAGWAEVPERTCHPVAMDNFNEAEGDGYAWAVCSECGRVLAVLSDGDGMPCFCPGCGARVVDGDE